MATRHYIVDIWITDNVISEDVLDTALCKTIQHLQEGRGVTSDEIAYDLVDMGEEDVH